MAVPDYQTLMLPALIVLGKHSPQASSEVRKAPAADFSLAPVDRKQMLPSGKQATFSNRGAWAQSYLKQAGLIASPRRVEYEITDRGRGVLAAPPARIDIGFLTQFPEFQAFRQGGEVREGDAEVAQPAAAAAQVVVRAGDEGIDGIINEDRLGLDAIYVQAKRWHATVGRPEIQRFAGALQGQRARNGCSSRPPSSRPTLGVLRYPAQRATAQEPGALSFVISSRSIVG